MLWSNSPFRSRILYLGLCIALASGLSGCFTPIYMDNSDAGVTQKLHEITIGPMPERLGHYLGTELIFQLNGTGEPAVPKYRLTINTNESNPTLVVDSQTGRADSASVFVKATYTLTAIDTGKVLTTGEVSAAAPYDRSSQRFANIRAARDGEIRVAQSLARDIKVRLSGFLANQSGNPVQ